MPPLKRHIVNRIQANGPMTLAEYMSVCLLHPEHGYYTTQTALGADGDFITAPEISQMFGELVGLSLAQAWLDQGAPSPFMLLELGPGRGTLMADIQRATARVPGFHDAAQLHLVEASPRMRAAQKSALPDADPIWHDDLSTLPDLPTFAVANEFFDALPIRQFQRGQDGWSERVVGLDGDALTLGLTADAPLAPLEHRMADTKDGDIVETCATAEAIIDALTAKIADHGGAALVIDYGDWHSLGDTFQALRGHKTTDPLADPGLADLTAHVDFEALAKAARCAHSRLTPQGVFLERLGITQRAQALATRMSGPALEAHIAAHRRLTHPEEMGHLFKVLGFYPEGATPPPGVEA
ncbi:class I SAM-dependent methyltransferase [Pseudoprimorskyibacter insulae]|uniref:Uncharacterized protein n=1 Tax=Pseudoprimorskyibacter insulae TaxID=1695997 RepID=A0A2R8ANQ2_9RHOB|nr:SAM-dependent methyltransferase [Pseudoprimorskyibacter insulae]SPF77643.1 hypothetical protein PRI8871_00227 [Pseudoprimorskyibacter insulae]